MNRLTGLIHIAKIVASDHVHRLAFLRKSSPHQFTWFLEEGDDHEIETPISASTIEEAIRLANKHWKNDGIHFLGCGFRYTLPERDEHGMNALFHQMVASLSSMTGVYFDEELGNNCFVQNASNEAKNIWKRLGQITHDEKG